jgi:hypothetical protein
MFSLARGVMYFDHRAADVLCAMPGAPMAKGREKLLTVQETRAEPPDPPDEAELARWNH